MIDDFHRVADGADLAADVCVVGSGPAGLAIARQFLGSSTSVLVLESGGLRPEESIELLNRGEDVGVTHTAVTGGGRARGFGGTTRLWDGQCIRMAPTDFEPRPWVPYSGWPIRRTDLDPFYGRAEALLGLPVDRFDDDLWAAFGVAGPDLDPARLQSNFSMITSRLGLAQRLRSSFRRSENVRMLLHATVTGIRANVAGSAVEAVELRSPLTGQRARVRARAFVLCCGSIENARLLLLSEGLGNRHDVVGRFFQDHTVGTSATIHSGHPSRLQEVYSAFYRRGVCYFPKITLSAEAQAQARVLNCTSQLSYEFDDASVAEAARRVYRRLHDCDGFDGLGTDVIRMARHAPQVAALARRRYVNGRSPIAPPRSVTLLTIAEQAPNPDSRVSLSSQRDGLGLPCACVRWDLTDLDRTTMATMAETVAGEFARAGLGTVEVADWLTEGGDAWSKHVRDACHHMGTTRMADDPARGVVDRDCRVHGVASLFVAGSSVFPTAGYANPTLTIVALALRLADHLEANLGR